MTISAIDAHAGEGGPDTGTFAVVRHVAKDAPPPNSSLVVFYQASGTASDGVDFQTLTGSVTIPALAFGTTITVTPIDDAAVEGEETVVVQLTSSPLACATCGYNIGVPSNAVVVIADNNMPPQTNRPPLVQLNAPQNGDVFIAPTTIPLRAYAQDAEDGFNLEVEFFEGTNSLGFGTFVATLCPAPYCPFFALNWSNVPPGNYTLTAKATDRSGVNSVSDPASIIVFGGVNIYATDPNASEIISAPNIDPPSNSAVFTVRRFGETNDGIVLYYEVSGTASNGVDYVNLPGQVTIPAGARSAEIVVQPIDDLLVEGTETVVLTLLPTCPQCLFVNPPCLPPEGTNCYPIGPDNRAVAYIHDNDTETNRPPVVNIVARDPFASEGTNFWRRYTDANTWTTDTWTLWQVNVGGTNTATFVVRRHGPTNDDLTVNCEIGGTASNGVDYLVLSGAATIPAGKHTARIVVTPIDDILPEGIETVVLKLQPSPDYAVGFPSHAAAIIIDDERPRPPCALLSDHQFHLCQPASNGFFFRVEGSTDLRNWVPLCTNVVTDGALHFVDSDAPPLNARFYRVEPEPGLPPDD